MNSFFSDMFPPTPLLPISFDKSLGIIIFSSRRRHTICLSGWSSDVCSSDLAQFNLGIMYAAGQGVPRDEAKSMGWMQKAADLGDAGAQHHIGMKLHRASLEGLPANASESRIQAYKWLQLAAAHAHRASA